MPIFAKEKSNLQIMDNDLEKTFNPQKLMDGVKDRIKSTFANLIPDNVWENMLEREIYIFTTGKIIPHHECDYSQKDENGNYVYKDWEERIPYSQTHIKDQYGKPTGEDDISPLQQMIRKEIRKKFEENLKEFLNSNDYMTVYNEYGQPAISKAVEEILVKNTDTIFRNFIGSIMQNGFNHMRYETEQMIQSGQYR
jgi:hypothetical protein